MDSLNEEFQFLRFDGSRKLARWHKRSCVTSDYGHYVIPASEPRPRRFSDENRRAINSNKNKMTEKIATPKRRLS